MTTNLEKLVFRLRNENAIYDALVAARKELPMDQRRFKSERLHQEANRYCREIMKTERAIITECLLEGGPYDDSEIRGLRAELAVRRHECKASTKNALAMRAKIEQLRAALGRLWSGVIEMHKDARTDYELPELAKLDLKSMTEQQEDVLAALAGGGGAELGDENRGTKSAAQTANEKLTD